MRELQSSYWCGHQDMQILPVSTANKAETGKKNSKIWGQKGDMVEKQKQKPNHLSCYWWGICLGMCLKSVVIIYIITAHNV